MSRAGSERLGAPVVLALDSMLSLYNHGGSKPRVDKCAMRPPPYQCDVTPGTAGGPSDQGCYILRRIVFATHGGATRHSRGQFGRPDLLIPSRLARRAPRHGAGPVRTSVPKVGAAYIVDSHARHRCA